MEYYILENAYRIVSCSYFIIVSLPLHEYLNNFLLYCIFVPISLFSSMTTLQVRGAGQGKNKPEEYEPRVLWWVILMNLSAPVQPVTWPAVRWVLGKWKWISRGRMRHPGEQSLSLERVWWASSDLKSDIYFNRPEDCIRRFTLRIGETKSYKLELCSLGWEWKYIAHTSIIWLLISLRLVLRA